MKQTLCIILLFAMTLSLTACFHPQPAYTPTGEVYVKTSPSRGDGGVCEVVDIEIEKAEYAAGEDITIPLKVGVGHLPTNEEDGTGYAYLKIDIWFDAMPKDGVTQTIQLDFPDWETSAYNSTEPEKARGLVIWAYYGDFYPLYHEIVELTIPKDVNFGYIWAELYITDNYGNEYKTRQVRLSFEKTEDILRFTAV